jgi:hypothetical protein
MTTLDALRYKQKFGNGVRARGLAWRLALISIESGQDRIPLKRGTPQASSCERNLYPAVEEETGVWRPR